MFDGLYIEAGSSQIQYFTKFGKWYAVAKQYPYAVGRGSTPYEALGSLNMSLQAVDFWIHCKICDSI